MAIMSEKKQIEAANKLKARTAVAIARKFVPEQLAFWHDDQRAIANELARSALFRCSDNRKARQYFDNVELFVLGEGQLTYKGEELRSRDEEVWLSLAHSAREMEPGKLTVKISSSDICKMNDWRQDQRYYNEIFLSIQRMKGGVINIFSRRLAKAIKCERALAAGASPDVLSKLYDELKEFEDSLHDLATMKGKEERGGMMMSLISGEPIFTGFSELKNNIPQGNLKWEITLSKEMVTLFARPYLTFVDSKIRHALTATGKRLQAYFLSHKNPYPVKLRSLEKMLGLKFGTLESLKYYMTEQLDALKHHKVIHDFSYSKSGDDWLVTVIRNAPEEKPTQND